MLKQTQYRFAAIFGTLNKLINEYKNYYFVIYYRIDSLLYVRNHFALLNSKLLCKMGKDFCMLAIYICINKSVAITAQYYAFHILPQICTASAWEHV